jgi:hypothetical protein
MGWCDLTNSISCWRKTGAKVDNQQRLKLGTPTLHRAKTAHPFVGPVVLFQTRIAAERIANWQYDGAPDGRFLINSLPSNTASPLTPLTGRDAALAGR